MATQRSFLFERDDSRNGDRYEEVPQIWKDSMIAIYQAYRQKFGDRAGLSDRELDLAEILAEQMCQAPCNRKPVWFLDDRGVSCVALMEPPKPLGLPPLLQGLDKLMVDKKKGDDDDWD